MRRQGREEVYAGSVPGNVSDAASGTITLADTSQQVLAANPRRQYLAFQNTSASGVLWIRFATAANKDQPSMRLAAGDAWVWEGGFVPTQALHVISATQGMSFTCWEG